MTDLLTAARAFRARIDKAIPPVSTDGEIDPTHQVDDPLAAEVAVLRAENRALFAALDAAKVIDAEAVKAEAATTKGDDALVLAVAKVLGASPEEVAKKRDADPQWFADIVAKYGLGRTDVKGDADADIRGG